MPATTMTEPQQATTKNGELEDVYTCQHGGPGELVMAEKQIFVASYAVNREKARKEQGWAQPHEVLATELVVLEEIITKHDQMKQLVDTALMRLYFSMATAALLKADLDQARIYARAGVYLAMYLRHGPSFWALTSADPETQKAKLGDMHIAVTKIASDAGLGELLNTQTPCDCLEQAFPALKDKK